MTGLAGMGPELATATTPSFSGPPSTGGLLDWWKQQPQPARDVVLQGIANLGNQRSPLPSPSLPSPMGGMMMQPPTPQPAPMGMPGMTGQPDPNAMAPFLQALAKKQGTNPYGFGTPSSYFQ